MNQKESIKKTYYYQKLKTGNFSYRFKMLEF